MDKTQQLMVFAIDDKLRTITMPNNGSVFGVSGDIEVNQVEFQMPRYCAGFDMTDFTGRVNYVNPNGDSNYYESEISGTDDTVSFIWLMKPDVTRYSGDVKFSVKLYKKQDGKILKQFNTRSAVGRVLEGFDVIDSVTPEEQETLLHKIEAEIKEEVKAYIDQYAEDKVSEMTQGLPEAVNSLKEDIGNIKKKKNVVIHVSSAELSDGQKLSCDYVCDGVDDQVEINQAIDSLPDSGGEIHLSRGIFNIGSNIIINKRIKIVGEGKSITLDRNNVNNGGTTLLTEAINGCVIRIVKSTTLSDIKGITLSDFQIVGAGIYAENNYCNGINVETYTDCVILERLAICHCFYGLFVAQNATVDDISVTNCDFQRDTTGIIIAGQGWQTRIENNIFWDMSGKYETSGIVLSSGQNIISGNYFGVSSLEKQGVANSWITANNGVLLLCNGNSFTKCESNPIRFQAGGQFANISGNSFYQVGRANFHPHEKAILYIDGAGTGGGRMDYR